MIDQCDVQMPTASSSAACCQCHRHCRCAQITVTMWPIMLQVNPIIALQLTYYCIVIAESQKLLLAAADPIKKIVTPLTEQDDNRQNNTSNVFPPAKVLANRANSKAPNLKLTMIKAEAIPRYLSRSQKCAVVLMLFASKKKICEKVTCKEWTCSDLRLHENERLM